MSNIQKYKEIYLKSKIISQNKKKRAVTVETKQFLDFLIKNNIFFDFILSKYFKLSNNDEILYSKTNIIYRDYYKNRTKSIIFINKLFKQLNIEFIEIKNDIFLKKKHSDIDILVNNKDFAKIKQKYKNNFEKFLYLNQKSKLELRFEDKLNIEILESFQWSRKLEFNYSYFLKNKKNSREINHYFTIFVELIYKKIYLDISDEYHLKNYKNKFSTDELKGFFLKKKEFVFFINTLNKYQKTIDSQYIKYPNYKILNIISLLIFELRNLKFNYLFYFYHFYCYFRYKYLNKLPFYKRNVKNFNFFTKKNYKFYI